MSLRAIKNYRSASPRRKKIFLALLLSLIPLVVAAFVLDLSTTVSVTAPFSGTGPLIQSAFAGNAVLPGQNFTGTWTLRSTVPQSIKVSAQPYTQSTQITFYGSWPVTVTIPSGSTGLNETVTFHVATNATLATYKIGMTLTWVP